jgi:hypothetical protein
MIKHICLLCCLLFVLQGKTQIQSQLITVEATILDSKTNDVIAFANVISLQAKKGTVSNVDGFFRMPNLDVKDTIIVSFVGYGKQVFSAISLLESKQIKLVKKVEGLREFAVLADNTYLYNLLDRARNTQTYRPKTAKTYFELKTQVGDKHVEMLECYFNGEFRGYDIETLKLKNGRIALAEFNKNLFISTETSKALSYHNLIDGNQYFPLNPLELSKNRMKRLFNLKLYSTFDGDDDGRFYVINFSPKKNLATAFSGTIWLDSASAQVIKITMDIENAQVYPIQPIKFTDSLDHVNLHITKNFSKMENEMYVQSVEFNYQMKYKNINKESYWVSTSAILTAYNYDATFTLPFFTFEASEIHKDFKQITAVPYNEVFWDKMTEFRINDMVNKNQFFKKHYSPEEQEALVSDKNGGVHVNMLYKGYLQWGEERILLQQENFLSTSRNPAHVNTPKSMMNFEIQTYLDVNVFEDSVNIVTQTLYDPFQSFYGYQKTVETQIFINIYFDLLEIERRKFETQTKKLGASFSEEKVIQLYEELKINNEQLRKKYYRDVDRGNNTKQLKEWNKKVFEALGIDNLKLFENFQMPTN